MRSAAIPSRSARKSVLQLEKQGCFLDPRKVVDETVKQDGFTSGKAIEEECSKISQSQMNACQVPNVIHLAMAGGSFKEHHYYAVKTMYDKIKPEIIFVHGYNFPLSTPLFNRSIHEFNLQLVASRQVTHIFDRPVDNPEHKSDVLRIESMVRFGGMYFDLDVYALDDMDIYMHDEAVMGLQNQYGLNSGMLIGKRCSRFFRRWRDSYKTFNDHHWDYQSIKVPLQLYREGHLFNVDPRGIRVIGTPLYNHYWTQILFKQSYVPEEWYGIRAIHAFFRDYGKEHQIEEFKTLDNNFGRLMRHIYFGGPNPNQLR